MNERIVVLMAKWPAPGRVKTRLAPALGAEGAARLYRAFLEDAAAESVQGPWETRLAFDPPEARDDFLALLPGLDAYVPQRGQDLTERMIAVFEAMCGPERAVVMRNTDSPTLPASHLEAAFSALDDENVDVVFGPDLGGGYCLVGLKRCMPELFRVEMSTGTNFARTLARAEELGLRTRLLEPWLDVDTPEDLAALRAVIEDSTAANTRAALRHR